MVEAAPRSVNTKRDSTDPALASTIKMLARDIGFDLVGIAAAGASAHGAFYQQWLAARRHGDMHYLARPDAVARRLDPGGPAAELKSAIVVGLHYRDEPESADPGTGIIARYARGRDYHRVVKRKLQTLLAEIEHLLNRDLPAARAHVDTGPVLERELAQRAGLGWFGRNTMLIHPGQGSFFFLGVLLVELELVPDETFGAEHCGTCNACVQACPTGALLGRDAQGAPLIDATRCISYLTIEHRGPIPRELRPLLGNRIFGCDICQDICPWNGPKFVQLTREPDLKPRVGTNGPRLIELLTMTELDWDEFSRGSALRRAKRAGFLRNVAVAIGNWGSAEAVPALVRALEDAEPLVRGHAAWALGLIGSAAARQALRTRQRTEQDSFVRDELDCALQQ